MKFVERYIRRPHLVLSVVLLLSVIGIMGYMKMPFNLFPDVDRPQISVITVMPGGAAGDVESDITRLIEKEVATIDMVRKVTSTSKDEASVVTAEFEYAKSLDAAATDVANALSKISARLPQGVRPPQIFKISQATQPVMTLALPPNRARRWTCARCVSWRTIRSRKSCCATRKSPTPKYSAAISRRSRLRWTRTV